MPHAERRDARVLIVDDDPGLRNQVADYLTGHQFRVSTASDVRAMDRVLAAGGVDVLVVDHRLPGEDGLSICKRLCRPRGPGIILLSADNDPVDRILGLEVGADDFMPKGCSPRELLARIRAVQRRRRASAVKVEQVQRYDFAGWSLDLASRQLLAPDGAFVDLTGGQFSLLHAFLVRPLRVLSRDDLLEVVRGPETESFDRAIDVQVSRLRRKLERFEAGPALIRTVRNEGYMFSVRPVCT